MQVFIPFLGIQRRGGRVLMGHDLSYYHGQNHPFLESLHFQTGFGQDEEEEVEEEDCGMSMDGELPFPWD
jgi:hypothetical protein